MKKLLSVILVAVILVSALSVAAEARGTCIFYDDFTTSFSPNNWVLRGGYDTCAYIWDHTNKYLYGQDDAIALQSNYVDGGKMWKSSYYSIDVRVQQGALGRTDKSSVVMQFQDLFQSGVNGAPVYTYNIILQTGEVFLEKDFSYTDTDGETSFYHSVIARATLSESIEIGPDAEWFSMGMRITTGTVQCYFNEKLVLESVYDPDDEKLGRRYNKNSPDSSVGAFAYPMVFLNYDNVLNLDNFQVWSSDYDFTTVAGDVNGDGNVNLSDVSLFLKYIAKWKNVSTDINQLDFNGDDISNVTDAALLLKYIAGWNVTLG